MSKLSINSGDICPTLCILKSPYSSQARCTSLVSALGISSRPICVLLPDGYLAYNFRRPHQAMRMDAPAEACLAAWPEQKPPRHCRGAACCHLPKRERDSLFVPRLPDACCWGTPYRNPPTST